MAQSILLFVLGFLCAGFLALMMTPPIWRRAVALTRKRVEGSVPLTYAEIQAGKDQIRAKFAMDIRRLEMEIKTLRGKSAVQMVEIGRYHEDLKTVTAESTQISGAVRDLDAVNGELRSNLGQRDEELQQLGEKLDKLGHELDKKTEEFEKLGQMYDDASFLASSRQIELVARESEIEQFSLDLTSLRNQRKDGEQQNREIATENQALREALKTEQKKIAGFEKRIERLIATVADREDKLERREKELARLREKLKAKTNTSHERAAQRLGVDATQADAEPASRDGQIDQTLAKLDADRLRLEARLAILVRDNRKLKSELAENGSSTVSEQGADKQDNARLREQMSNLAAEVVHLTAMLDGADSPIAKLMDAPDNGNAQAKDGRDIISLADRIRALQKAGSPLA